MRLPFRDAVAAAGGGDAELQTDVMRFFAILAICVIALTSLVESTDRRVPEAAAAPPVSALAEPPPVSAPAEPLPVREPAQRPDPLPPASGPAVPDSVSPAEATSLAEVGEPPAENPDPSRPVEVRPATEVPAAAPVADEDGLSLRFASPQAMLRLVSSRQVVVFAAVSGRGYRLTPDGRRFRPETLPPALYLMAPATIPDDLSRALAREAGGAAEITWGVTLSGTIRRRLADALDAGVRGLLLIDAAGRVAPAGEGP